jgi:polyhydroxyalkanoate synthase
MDPDDWAAQTPVVQGSWWEAMDQWIKQRSGAAVKAQPIKAEHVVCDAPGEYVMVRYAD